MFEGRFMWSLSDSTFISWGWIVQRCKIFVITSCVVALITMKFYLYLVYLIIHDQLLVLQHWTWTVHIRRWIDIWLISIFPDGAEELFLSLVMIKHFKVGHEEFDIFPVVKSRFTSYKRMKAKNGKKTIESVLPKFFPRHYSLMRLLVISHPLYRIYFSFLGRHRSHPCHKKVVTFWNLKNNNT